MNEDHVVVEYDVVDGYVIETRIDNENEETEQTSSYVGPSAGMALVH